MQCEHPFMQCEHPCMQCEHPCMQCEHPCMQCEHPCMQCEHPCMQCAALILCPAPDPSLASGLLRPAEEKEKEGGGRDRC